MTQDQSTSDVGNRFEVATELAEVTWCPNLNVSWLDSQADEHFSQSTPDLRKVDQWIGGTIFLSVVLVPVFKREPFASQKALLFRTIARRFRAVVRGAIAVLLFTGPLLLHQRGIPIADPSGWPMVLAAKLGLMATLLLLTLTHDLTIGPRVGRILRLPTESRTRFDQALVLWSP